MAKIEIKTEKSYRCGCGNTEYFIESYSQETQIDSKGKVLKVLKEVRKIACMRCQIWLER